MRRALNPLFGLMSEGLALSAVACFAIMAASTLG